MKEVLATTKRVEGYRDGGRGVCQGQGGFTGTLTWTLHDAALKAEELLRAEKARPEGPSGKGAELGCRPHGDVTGSHYKKFRWHEGSQGGETEEGAQSHCLFYFY